LSRSIGQGAASGGTPAGDGQSSGTVAVGPAEPGSTGRDPCRDTWRRRRSL